MIMMAAAQHWQWQPDSDTGKPEFTPSEASQGLRGHDCGLIRVIVDHDTVNLPGRVPVRAGASHACRHNSGCSHRGTGSPGRSDGARAADPPDRPEAPAVAMIP
jgi:hypothetical protein